MKLALKQKIILLFSFLCFVAPVHAYLTPFLITNSEISYGEVLFTAGNCTLDHLTGEVSASNPSFMCGLDGNSTAGDYRIVANPNKQVSIKILQRDLETDGFIYIPAGELISDSETIVITPNIAQEIDSGSDGNIRIRLGGTLHISKEILKGTSFEFTKIEGIEWSELP